MYRYKLYRTTFSSARLGNCEVCGGYANEVYHLVEERKYVLPNGQEGWTRHKCLDVFGHEECLRKLGKTVKVNDNS